MEKLSRAFYIFILLFLLLPIAQQIGGFIHTHPLDGAFVVPEYHAPSVSTFIDGRYQRNTARVARFNFGLRADFVRTSNELNYRLYNELNTMLVVGEDNYLFDPNYTAAWLGKDLMPGDSLAKLENNLIGLQQAAKRRNITLIFIFAPNKSKYYANYLPEQIMKNEYINNKSVVLKMMQRNHLAFFDVDKWFEKMPVKNKCPLIPKHGAHWSQYGATLAFDSLLKILDDSVQEFHFERNFSGFRYTYKAHYPDDDYNASLNLISRLPEDTLCYPMVHFGASGKKVNVVFIGDSFVWNWFYINGFDNVFDKDSKYYYYNTAVYNLKKEKLNLSRSIADENAIENADALIVVISDPNLKDLLPQSVANWNKLLVNGI